MREATRALGIIRLSKTPDPASTSVERQREIIEQYIETRGMILAGWAEDLAVSAFKVPPMRRRQLRAWLNDERAEDFDCLVYWRQDRIVRQPWDFIDLVRWATDHGKALESATEGTGDVTQHANMLVGFIASWQASGESRNTSARVKSSYHKLRGVGRYPGGRVAYGFTSVKRINGPGYEVVPDTEPSFCNLIDRQEHSTAELLAEAARRVIAGESTNAVAGDFNRRGIPASDGGNWWRNALRKVLQNPAMIGTIVSAEDFGKLQDSLDMRRNHKEVKTLGRDSLLLDLVFCGECGGKIYRQKVRDRYVGRCRNELKKYEVPTPCHAPQAPYAFLEAAAEASILEHGDDLIEEKVTNATRKLRLDEITRELLSLPAEYAARRITRDEMTARQSALLDEQERIEAAEGSPEWRQTGETVRQRWERLSVADRRLWLLRIGTTFKAYHFERWHAGTQQRKWRLQTSWIPVDKAGQPDSKYRERVVRP